MCGNTCDYFLCRSMRQAAEHEINIFVIHFRDGDEFWQSGKIQMRIDILHCFSRLAFSSELLYFDVRMYKQKPYQLCPGIATGSEYSDAFLHGLFLSECVEGDDFCAFLRI